LLEEAGLVGELGRHGQDGVEVVDVAAGQTERLDLGELAVERLGGYEVAEVEEGRVD